MKFTLSSIAARLLRFLWDLAGPSTPRRRHDGDRSPRPDRTTASGETRP